MVSSRIPQLDLLRGIAVLLVLLYHYPYVEAFQIGWIGVDLFFVLSGFLISGLLFAEWTKSGTINVGRFYLRRGFKIYPAFYFFLFTATWAYILGQPAFWQHPLSMFGSEVFFLQNYLPHIWPHTWSLAVEEQFYLLLPVLLLIIVRLLPGRRGFALVPVVAVAVIIGCLVFRIVRHPASAEDVRWALHYRADALFAGVALGYLFQFRRALFLGMSRSFLLPLGLALLTPAWFFTSAKLAPWVLTCNLVAFACILVFTVPRVSVRFKWLELVGIYSYSIYIWHVPVAVIFRGNSPHHMLWLLPYLAAAIAFGIYMAKLIEIPALAYRDRVFPPKSEPSAHVPTPCLVVPSTTP